MVKPTRECSSKTYFADAAATLLGFAEPATELVGQPRMLGPMVPTEGFVMRTAIGGNQLDGVFADF